MTIIIKETETINFFYKNICLRLRLRLRLRKVVNGEWWMVKS